MHPLMLSALNQNGFDLSSLDGAQKLLDHYAAVPAAALPILLAVRDRFSASDWLRLLGDNWWKPEGEFQHHYTELDVALPMRGPVDEFMDEIGRRTYDGLPDPMVVHRGVSCAGSPAGFSWTQSWDLANLYSRRQHGGQWRLGHGEHDPAVISMRLPKKFALATQRTLDGEQGDVYASPEIIARYCRSRVIRVERPAPISVRRSLERLYAEGTKLGFPVPTVEEIDRQYQSILNN